MYETQLTVVGRLATAVDQAPVRRRLGRGELPVASTERRYDRASGGWVGRRQAVPRRDVLAPAGRERVRVAGQGRSGGRHGQAPHPRVRARGAAPVDGDAGGAERRGRSGPVHRPSLTRTRPARVRIGAGRCRRRPGTRRGRRRQPPAVGRRPSAGDALRGWWGPHRAARADGGATTIVDVAEFIYTMQKVRKAHGDKVILDDVTLNFLPGAKIGVVGPNGAGKSTVLRIMAGLEHAEQRRGLPAARGDGRHPPAGAAAERGEDGPGQRRGGARRDQGPARPVQRDRRADGHRLLRRAHGGVRGAAGGPGPRRRLGASTRSSSRRWTRCAARRRTPRSRPCPVASGAGSRCASCC